MFVRSQNKKSLVDISGCIISTLNFTTKTSIVAYGNNQESVEYQTLGDYSTEEKAIKVLDMIQDSYCVCPYKEDYDGIPHSAPFPKVFQMPLESEVTP